VDVVANTCKLLLRVRNWALRRLSLTAVTECSFRNNDDAPLLWITKSVVEPIPVAVRSEAWVCGRSLTGIVASNPA
jgi:hypothetical protein